MSEPKNYFITLNDKGLPEYVDFHTGETIPLEVPLEDAELSPNEDNYITLETDKGIVWVPKGTDINTLYGLNAKYIPYSPLLADRFCDLVANGTGVTKVCERSDMPSYSNICKWRRLYPEFEKKLEQARQDRAELYFEKTLEIAESTDANRDEINLAKLKIDAYRKSAQVGNPDRFGDRQNVKAQVAVGSYVIETGIRRDQDPGFNKDITLEISDAERRDESSEDGSHDEHRGEQHTGDDHS